MRAEELMVGDWYQWYADGKYYKYQVKPEDFTKDYVANFEPIHLTPEILEKNGFKKIDFSHYQINDRTLVLDADGKWDSELSWHWVVTEMSSNSKGQNVVLDYYVATLKYVHELQRALKCCELWDMANDFKV